MALKGDAALMVHEMQRSAFNKMDLSYSLWRKSNYKVMPQTSNVLSSVLYWACIVIHNWKKNNGMT